MFAPFRSSVAFLEDKVWSKVILFSFTLFLIRIADAIISFWAPNQIQSSLGSSAWMGIIISFQSIIGFGADLSFAYEVSRLGGSGNFCKHGVFFRTPFSSCSAS